MAKTISILMYHSLEGFENSGSPGRRLTTVTLEDFEIQMSLLRQHGFNTIHIADFLSKSYEPTSVNKDVIITFDDGYYTTFKNAAPILKKYNFVATLFLPTTPVGKSSFRGFPGFEAIATDRPLSWAEISLLDKEGWSIQSHGLNHPRLSELKKDEIIFEVTHSKKIIEEKLGKVVDYFAFPFGDYDGRVLSAVRNAGYAAGFSVHPGKAGTVDNKFRLRRVEINNMDTAASFLRKIETGYGSEKERLRSVIRDVIYMNPAVKDLLKSMQKLFT